MVTQNSSAALQGKMQSVRRKLDEDADEMVKKARIRFDWRHYVANHPLASCAVAAAAGYFLVPRQIHCKCADSRAPSGAAGHLEATAQSARPSAASGVVAGMMGMITSTLAQEGATLATQFVRRWLDRGKTPSSRDADEGTKFE